MLKLLDRILRYLNFLGDTPFIAIIVGILNAFRQKMDDAAED